MHKRCYTKTRTRWECYAQLVFEDLLGKFFGKMWSKTQRKVLPMLHVLAKESANLFCDKQQIDVMLPLDITNKICPNEPAVV